MLSNVKTVASSFCLGSGLEQRGLLNAGLLWYLPIIFDYTMDNLYETLNPA